MEMHPPDGRIQMRLRMAQAVAEECIRVLKERFGVRRAFVFGSLRGDSPWHERSDIDIAVEGLPPEKYIEALTTLYDMLPNGMHLDLVRLESAPNTLTAMAKGEMNVPGDAAEALRVEVDNELLNLQQIVQRVDALLQRVDATPNEEQLIALGKYIHDFYNTVEGIFERIEQRLEVPMPIGRSWHTHLLRQIEREIPNKRPAVVEHELARKLNRFLRFRHLYRHTYGYELQWEELQPLVEMLPEVFTTFRTQLMHFLERLQASC